MNDLTTDELFAGYAAGRLPEPVALIVATCVSINPVQARRFATFATVGGTLLDTIEPEADDEVDWDRLQAKLTEPSPPIPSVPRHSELPRPLSDYVDGPLSKLRWVSYGPVAEATVPVASSDFRTKLIRVKAGRSVPQHTHVGHELTLVLEGAFHDDRGHYRKGDLVIADSMVDHRPVADSACDCLCLAVTDAPLRLTGKFARLFNPFINL